MRRKWILLLVGWLMVVGVTGCDQAVPPDTPAGEAVAATATSEPINTPEARPSPGIGPSEEETPSAIGTPAPLWTVVPISPTQVIQEDSMTVIPTIPTPSNPALQKMVTQAKEDLAQRLAIKVEQIELVEARAVVWPDGSLGCPRPGMVYIQVQQDGMLIRLRVGKSVYNYHSGGTRPPFLCEQSSGNETLVPPPGMGDQ